MAARSATTPATATNAQAATIEAESMSCHLPDRRRAGAMPAAPSRIKGNAGECPPVGGPDMPAKRYVVTLTPDERGQLEALTRAGTRSARTVTRARVLLLADQGDGGLGWED